MAHHRGPLAAGILSCLLLVACSTSPASGGPAGSPSVAAPSGGSPGGAAFDAAAARQYCTDQGGMLVDRVATYNTNADRSAWVEFAGRETFCEFQSGTGDQATRISVDLVTLYSPEPTLAGVAYLSKVTPKLPPQPSANPADYNCNQNLGGTSTFGSGAAGGGWVDTAQPVFVVMDMCTFMDTSAIDAWGIFYYANGTVRGADLATKMRYHPGTQGLPAVFGS